MATSRRSHNGRVGEIVRALKLAKPDSLRAVLRDGEEHAIAMVGQRGAYERAARTLISLDATHAHCIDSSGKITETIAVDDSAGTDTTDEANARVKERTRDQELAALLKIALDAQDKVASRYEGILASQAQICEQLTKATLSVMHAAGQRASSLEKAMLRLTLDREKDLDGREHELLKLARKISASQDEDEVEEEEPMDPAIRELIDIAKGAVGIGGERRAAPDTNGATKKKPKAATTEEATDESH